jgi:catechol 2,3-dioxygenase-like lactoylglutathione lyase family enzyme
MSKIFGPVVQQGYVVPDINVAIEHWLARGIGPFFVEHLNGFTGNVDGEDVTLDLSAAFAYSGDQQIEVIQAHGSTPSIYGEYLKENPKGGLQHLAVWVDDIDISLAEYAAAGVEVEVRQRYGDGHAYIDLKSSPGVMIQLMAHNDAIDLLFSIIKEASETWDGETDPVRKIDWSTGKPVVTAA